MTLSANRLLKVSRTLKCKPMDIFKAVVDVEKYPEFLPYCSGARIQKQADRRMIAEVDFKHKLFKETILYDIKWLTPRHVQSVATNTIYCNRIEYVWDFIAEGNDSCKTDLRLDIDFHSTPTALMFDMFAGSVQDDIFQSFSDRVSKKTI